MARMFVVFAVVSALLGVCGGVASCNDVHFWVEEGQFLQGDLQDPPTINNNFHRTMYAALPDTQPDAMVGCSGSVSFLLTGTGPTHHTITPDGYTPKVLAFTLKSGGNFTYISRANSDSPTVWNGYDKFTWSATCTTGGTCTGTAYINVVYTSAATHNANPTEFTAGYDSNTVRPIKCTGTCENGTTGMYYVRHTLPRLWDVMENEAGTLVKPTVQWEGENKDSDGLDFEWTSNYAIITTYGPIGNMAVRFPTMEEVTWKPGQFFTNTNVLGHVNSASTGFDPLCLGQQVAADTDKGSDVWTWTSYPTTGTAVGTNYNTSDSWYQKFGGKHSSCNVFNAVEVCKYAPLLSPAIPTINATTRLDTREDVQGVWKVAINNCTTRWQGKFTWNSMRQQTLFNGNKAWNIAGPGAPLDANGYTITANFYNEAVQPNSWSDYRRGFAWLNKKYILKIVLRQDTDYEFKLGIDIFTVDLQWFRYQNGANDHAFGYNMIIYPKVVNEPTITPQSQPDRRIKGFKWNEHSWVAPSTGQCPANSGCATRTAGTGSTPCVHQDATGNGPVTDYTGDAMDGNCGVGVARVYLFKGPSTTTAQCSNTDEPMTAIYNTPGVSPQDPVGTTCKTDFQNITLRGVATGSSGVTADNGFGFEGKIVLTFLLVNGEHPHFQITPKLYVQSLSVQGSFAGTTATCRGSPKWPVVPTTNLSSSLPTFLCEEVDARTFGPTDWAIILFDIKDVDPNLVTLRKLYVVFSGLNKNIYFHNESGAGTGPNDVMWDVNHGYLHYRNLKALNMLHTHDSNTRPSHPSGVNPPPLMDFGFAFTPGAHNENTKITIYCTLRVQTSTPAPVHRRFAAAQDTTGAPPADNIVTENIHIEKGFNQQRAALTVNGLGQYQQAAGSQGAAAGDASKVTTAVLAAVCAVLLAAVVGMALFVRTRLAANTPKRVGSGTTLS